MKNIQFLLTVYYYPRGDKLFLAPTCHHKPWMFWGDEVGYTEMTRKEFTSAVLLGEIVRISEL